MFILAVLTLIFFCFAKNALQMLSKEMSEQLSKAEEKKETADKRRQELA